jgi:hypothetical protein
MPWLRHFALFLVFVTALFRPAAAGAFVSAPDAGSQARVGAFELVAATLVGPASGVTCGLHEGIGAAYDENASGYRFAAGGTEALATRAGEVHGALHPVAQRMRTTAVLETSGGRVVAGGGPDLTPAQRALLGPGESAARLPGAHAEGPH